MPLLHTALQEGFSGDEVTLRLDGREIFHQAGVKTRTQIGLAATHELQVSPGDIVLEVSLPHRNLDTRIPLHVTHDTYVGVSITPDRSIRHVVRQEPFGYV